SSSRGDLATIQAYRRTESVQAMVASNEKPPAYLAAFHLPGLHESHRLDRYLVRARFPEKQCAVSRIRGAIILEGLQTVFSPSLARSDIMATGPDTLLRYIRGLVLRPKAEECSDRRAAAVVTAHVDDQRVGVGQEVHGGGRLGGSLAPVQPPGWPT